MLLTDIQPAREDDPVVDEPPRNTSKATLPDSCVLRRSAFNRAKLFVPDATEYVERRCSQSITQYVDREGRFHPLAELNARSAEDYASTSLCCWHCAHRFEGSVVPLPKAYDAGKRCFVVFGCFCSLSCAKAFLCEHPTFETGMQLILLERMAAEVYGVSDVVASPPRLSLSAFGGPYSLDRFRTLATRAEATMRSPPFVSSYMVCEERALEETRASAMDSASMSSVRGLRRPAHPIRMRPTEPPECSPYLDFVRRKQAPSEPQEPPSARPPPPPSSAAAPPLEAKPARKGALAKFMM